MLLNLTAAPPPALTNTFLARTMNISFALSGPRELFSTDRRPDIPETICVNARNNES